jgi:DNA-binding HxlR family transcriptional regulator
MSQSAAQSGIVSVLLSRVHKEIPLPDKSERGSYGQFCPVAMAAEIFCNRWTALVMRELLCGTTRFNELRRGVPRMSPTLLSKRLKELEEAGVIVAVPTNQYGVVDYKLTEAGEDLRGIVMALGFWGQRWVESTLSLKNLDPGLLMWDMRRTAGFNFAVQLGDAHPHRCHGVQGAADIEVDFVARIGEAEVDLLALDHKPP